MKLSVTWRNWPRCRPKKICTFLCLFIVFVFLFITTRIMQTIGQRCSNTNTVKTVQMVCSMYHEGKVSGELCSSLCDTDHFAFNYCGQTLSAGKSVLVMDCNGCNLGKDVDKVVIKIGINMTSWINISNKVIDESQSMYETINKTKAFILRQFVAHLRDNIVSENDVLAMVLGNDLIQFVKETTSNGNYGAWVRTLLALALQNEYIKLVSLKRYSFTPELYGFCGPAFFVEYTTPLTLLGHMLPFNAIPSELIKYRFNFKPWPERARVALDLIQTAQKIETTIGGVVDICDIHPKNVGLNNDNKVAFFDLDDTRYRAVFTNSSCIVDKECSFETCEGYCDTLRRKCLDKRRNNNLQAICSQLFYGYHGIGGILRFPPWSVRTELKIALDHCISPGAYYNTRTNKAGPDIAERLERVLRKSLET